MTGIELTKDSKGRLKITKDSLCLLMKSDLKDLANQLNKEAKRRDAMRKTALVDSRLIPLVK